MTGGYPPYYDPYYDYYGDGYYNGYMGRPSGGKRYQGDRERHPSKGDKDKQDKDKVVPKNIAGEEEFVSWSHRIWTMCLSFPSCKLHVFYMYKLGHPYSFSSHNF